MIDIVNSRNLHGYVTVQVFDKENKIQEVSTHNIIMPEGIYNLNLSTMANGIVSNLASGISVPALTKCFGVITLHSSEVDPSYSDYYPSLGAQIGYSTQGTYSGTSATRGSINAVETLMSWSRGGELRMHYVFDWPTHAANGTFRTIAWGYDSTLPCVPVTQFRAFNNGTAEKACAYDGTYLWLGNQTSDNIYKVDPKDGVILEIYPSPALNPYSMTYDGTNIWLTCNTSPYYFWRINPDTFYATQAFTPPEQMISLSYGDGYLWGLASGNKVYKMTAAGTVVEQVTLTGSLSGIGWYNGYVYTYDYYGANRLLKWDSDWNVLSTFGISNQNIPSYYLIFIPTGEFYSQGITSSGYYYSCTLYSPPSIGAQTLLPEPVTKTAINTMKIQYDFVIE